MKCDCIIVIKEKLREELPKSPTYAAMKILSIDIEGEGFAYAGNKTVHVFSVPVTVTHEPIGRKKTTKTHLIVSYCPFCGTPC